jgi:hypothetical protein
MIPSMGTESFFAVLPAAVPDQAAILASDAAEH